MVLVFLVSGCAVWRPPKPVVELSRAELDYYESLHPAFTSFKGVFEKSSRLLDESATELKENALRTRSLPRREASYQPVFSDLASKKNLEDSVPAAVDELTQIEVDIREQIAALKKASGVERQAIVDSLTALEESLRVIIQNQQLIQAELEGRAAAAPWKNIGETIRYLKENRGMLKEQFELAKEIYEEARKQFEGESKEDSD